MGQYKSQHTGPQIDAGINAALNPDLVPTDNSDALITSDAVAKVQQGFAPIETAATSANSYAIGDLLVWGGVLYKAKTSITAGDSFVVDTNIEATTVADKLNNIDTEITSDTDTTLTGLLTGNGSKVGTKSLDTSSLTNDADHVPASSVVKSALDAKADKNDLATIHQTSPTCTETNGIAAGVFFYLDNELVVAKTAIANGATFTNGTNYESPTAGGLNALKSAFMPVDVKSKITWALTDFMDRSNVYKIGNLVILNAQLLTSGSNTAIDAFYINDASILPKGWIFGAASMQEYGQGAYKGAAQFVGLDISPYTVRVVTEQENVTYGAVVMQLVWVTN